VRVLLLTVTPAIFAALAARPPAAPAAPEPEAPRAEAVKEPPKKKGWWPFG